MPAERPGSGPATVDGPRAAAFKAETLSGRTVSFPGDYRGKLVLLDFWATWCTPCREELPRVAQIDERYRGQGLAVLGISLDQPRTTVGSVASFVKERKMTWDQVYRDAPQIAMQYGVFSIPAAFLVDGDTGAILASGDELRGDLLQKTVEAQLKTRKP